MKPRTTAIAALVLCVLAATAPLAHADVHTYKVGFDLDHSPTTGCDMSVDEAGYAGGPIPGIELILNLVVDTSFDPPMIVETAIEECSGAAFLAPVVIDDVDRPIGANMGTGGSDVVSGVLPGSYSSTSPVIGLVFASLTESGGEDLVLDGGGPFDLAQQIPGIPTLTEWGVILFGLILATAAIAILRRRSTVSAAVGVVIFIGAAGVVLAAIMAPDPLGDTTSGERAADIVGVAASSRSLDVFVSLEIDELESAAPVAEDDDVTTDEDTVLNGDVFADNGNGADFDPDGDPFQVTEVNGNSADVGVQITLASGALLTVNSDGTFSYDPNAQFDDVAAGDSSSDTFTYTVEDSFGASATATVTVTVTGVNDAPTLTVGGTIAYQEDDPPTAINNSLLVDDVDGPDMTGAVVSITAGFTAGEDVLAATDQLGITSSYAAGSGVLTLTGTGPASAYQTVLRTVTYQNTNTGDPDAGNRTVTFSVNDTIAPAVTDTATVIFAAGEDPPEITSSATPSAPENQTLAIDVESTDPDGDTEGAGLTYTLSGGADQALFSIDANTGVLTFNVAPDFENPADADTDNVYVVQVTVTDSSTLTDVQNLQVTVTNVNEAPVDGDETYSAIGNTQMIITGGTATASGAATVTSTVNLLAGAVDPEGATLATVPISGGTTTGGGNVDVFADGTFAYLPPLGFEGADTFGYTVTDGSGGTDPSTATINVAEVVWYIDNTASSGGDGRSTAPFDELADFNAIQGGPDPTADPEEGDVIFVLEGDGTTAGLDVGITPLDDQKLIGQGVDLDFAGFTPSPLVAATNHSKITNTGAGVTVANATGVEIRGLDITGTAIGIDVNATAGSSQLVVTDNIITGTTGGHGIDVSSSGTADLELVFDRNSVESGDTAVTPSFAGASFVGTSFSPGAGTLTITSFADLMVPDGAVAVGTGITVSYATFDADAATFGIQPVAAGGLTIGDSGGLSRTLGPGLAMSRVVGDLQFTSVDIYNSGGTGLVVDNSANASAADFTLAVGTGEVDTTAGTAIDLEKLTMGAGGINLTDASAENPGGAPGISLDTVSGSMTVGGGSITGASSAAFLVDQSNADINYAGTITNTAGRSVELTNNTGGTIALAGAVDDDGEGVFLNNNTGATMEFTGGLDLATSTNTAFSATNGGTVAVTGTNVVTTTTGVGVNIVGTTIGASRVTFESISVNGAANGAVLVNTGTTGGLTVTGDGTGAVNGSGGTIQNTTGSAIVASATQGLDLQSVNIIDPTGDGLDADDITGDSVVRSCRFTELGNNVDGIDWLADVSGTSSLTVSSSLFQGSSGATNNRGIAVETSVSAHNATLTVNDIGGAASDSIFDRLQGSGVVVTAGSSFGSGDVAVTIQDSIFRNAEDVTLGQTGIDLGMNGSSNLTATVDNATMTSVMRAGGDSGAINFTNGVGSSGNLIATVQNSTITDSNRQGIGAILVSSVTGTFTFDTNVMNDVDRAGIRVRSDENADANVTITNNSIGATTPVGGTSGVTRDGIWLQIRDNAGDEMRVLMSNNTVVINNTRQVVDIDAEDGDTCSVTLFGNTLTNLNGAGDGFDIAAEDTGSTVNLDLNSSGVAANRNSSNLGYRLQHQSGSFRIEVDPLDAVVNTAGVSYTDAQTETFFNSRNDGGSVLTPNNMNNFFGIAAVSVP